MTNSDEASGSPGDAPLAGLRVVEVSSFVAAPLGGRTLAQLGAEVIRIDPAGGGPDYTRWPVAPSGTSLYWTGLNKNKRSVALDLRSADGQQAVRDLVVNSGPDGAILLTNASYPWLDYGLLRRHRADVIVLRITGTHDGATAVDYTVNAGIGFPLTTGPADLAGPVNHVLPAWDVACGLYAATGILAAERHRRRTGQGRAITLALGDVALAVTGHLGFLAEPEVTGVSRPRIGNHLYGSFARDFPTASGESVLIVILTSRHFADLGRATGLAGTFSEVERAVGGDFSTDAGTLRPPRGHRRAARPVVRRARHRRGGGDPVADLGAVAAVPHLRRGRRRPGNGGQPADAPDRPARRRPGHRPRHAARAAGAATGHARSAAR